MFWSPASAGNGLATGKARAVRRAQPQGNLPPPPQPHRLNEAEPASAPLLRGAHNQPTTAGCFTGGTTQCPRGGGGEGRGDPTVGRSPVRNHGPATPPPPGRDLRQSAPPAYCVWRLGARRAPERPSREEPKARRPAGSGVLRGHSRAARTPRRSLPRRLALRAGVRAPALSPQSRGGSRSSAGRRGRSRLRRPFLERERSALSSSLPPPFPVPPGPLTHTVRRVARPLRTPAGRRRRRRGRVELGGWPLASAARGWPVTWRPRVSPPAGGWAGARRQVRLGRERAHARPGRGEAAVCAPARPPACPLRRPVPPVTRPRSLLPVSLSLSLSHRDALGYQQHYGEQQQRESGPGRWGGPGSGGRPAGSGRQHHLGANRGHEADPGSDRQKAAQPGEEKGALSCPRRPRDDRFPSPPPPLAPRVGPGSMVARPPSPRPGGPPLSGEPCPRRRAAWRNVEPPYLISFPLPCAGETAAGPLRRCPPAPWAREPAALHGLFPVSPPGAARWKVPEGRAPFSRPFSPSPFGGPPTPSVGRSLPPPREPPGCTPPAPPGAAAAEGRGRRGRGCRPPPAPRPPPRSRRDPLGGAAPFPLPSAFCFPRRGLARPRSRLAAGNGSPISLLSPPPLHPTPRRQRSPFPPRRGELRRGGGGEAAARRAPLRARAHGSRS